MLRQEPVTVTVQRFKVDRLGYLFCGHCLGFGHGGEIQTIAPDSSGRIEHGAKCDGCWKPRAQWSTVDVKTTTEAEHFTGIRIF